MDKIIILYSKGYDNLVLQIRLMESLGFVLLNDCSQGYDELNDESFFIQAMRQP